MVMYSFLFLPWVLGGEGLVIIRYNKKTFTLDLNNNNNNIRLVTLAEHTSDHGKQTNSSTKERGSRDRKLLGANAKIYRLKTKIKTK